MAQKFDVGNGLAQLWYYVPDKSTVGTDGPFANLRNQTDLYLQAIAGKLPEPEFTDKKTYISLAHENGLQNQTTEHNYFENTKTYVDDINKTGSDILIVDTTQTGNQDVAQVNKFDAYDAYYARSK